MVTYSEGYDFNIMNELDNSGVSQDGTSITMNVNFRFKFNDWLSANAIASYTSQNTTMAMWLPAQVPVRREDS